MKKSILAVCILTLVLCLFSCDINAFNEFLSKAKGKFLKESNSENNKAEDLNFRKRNQAGQSDVVVNITKGLEINKNFQNKEKDIELGLKNKIPADMIESHSVYQAHNKLTSEEEVSLVKRDIEANEIKIEIDDKLSEINARYNELNTLLSKLKSMESRIMDAKSDFEKARRPSSGNMDVDVKKVQFLEQAINNVKYSKDIAIALYKDELSALELAKASAEHANSCIKSALGESEQARSSGYYYVDYMIDNISKARISLSKANNMLNKVELNIGKIKSDMEKAEKDSFVLDNAHQALKEKITR